MFPIIVLMFWRTSAAVIWAHLVQREYQAPQLEALTSILSPLRFRKVGHVQIAPSTLIGLKVWTTPILGRVHEDDIVLPSSKKSSASTTAFLSHLEHPVIRLDSHQLHNEAHNCSRNQ
jgi:hypothetical protein